MKRLIRIFLEQLHSKEIWTRIWELNRFHRFQNYQEWKKTSLRLLTMEDVPAIVVTTLLAIGYIFVLSIYLVGSNFRYALICSVVIIVAISRLVGSIKKQ